MNASGKKKILLNFLGHGLCSISLKQRGNKEIKSFNNKCQLESKTKRNNEINFPEKAYPILNSITMEIRRISL